MAKLKGAKPSTLIRRGDVKHKYAASLSEHFIQGCKCCRNEHNRETKCRCLMRLDDAFLSAIERYVDSTWKELSFIEKLAIAKNQSPVESWGVRAKFYLPFENGSQFHPVCANTFCRLLGCSFKEFPQMKRALADRDWLFPDLVKEIELLPSGTAQRSSDDGGRPSCFMCYFIMKDGLTHGLQHKVGHDDKRIHGADIFSDIDAVESVLVFVPSSETTCVVGGLAIKPHGSEELSNLPSFLQKMAEHSVEVVELNKSMVGADGLVRNDQFDFILGHEEC